MLFIGNPINSSNNKIKWETNQPLHTKQEEQLVLLSLIAEKNINSVIIEGGAKTLQLFIDAEFWDEARVFIGKTIFKEGLKAPKMTGRSVSQEKIIDDTLRIYVNN